MIARLFHGWEQRLADVSRDERVVRPFEWGVDWMDLGHPPAASGAHVNGSSLHASDPEVQVRSWVSRIMADTDAFFTPTPSTEQNDSKNSRSTSLVKPTSRGVNRPCAGFPSK